MTERFAVLGSPIAHSLSPALHRAAFAATGRDATYEAREVVAGGLAAALEELVAAGFAGVNLTSPLKVEGLALAHEASAAARAAGAANTLAFREGRIVATNTDGTGFVTFLERAGVGVAGRAIAFLGGGGAAAGLVPALRAAGAGAIGVAARTPGRTRALAPGLAGPGVTVVPLEHAEACVRGASLVVQATPLGLAPGDPLPCPTAWVAAEAVAIDLLYHPAVTPWLAQLRARGVRAANGLGLLIEQALEAQRFWFGTRPPRPALEAAVGWQDPFSPPSSRGPEGSPAG